MKVRMRHGERTGDRLVSWRNPGDPSPGSFTYGIDPVTSLQLFTWNGSSPLWRSPVWTGYRVANEFIKNTSTVVYFTVRDVGDEASMLFTVSDGAPRMRYVMSYSGELVLQSWSNASLRWDDIDVWPPYECSRYGHCGPFGYCDQTAAVPTCECLDGFEPTSGEEWSSGRFSRGCRRKEALRCGDGEGDGFLALPAMKAPDRFVLVGNRSLDECAAECRRNCSCVAYAHAKLSSSAKGDPTRCLVWGGELIDAEKIGATTAGSEMMYLRLAGLATGRRTDRKKLKIVLPVLASVLLTCISLLIWRLKCKGQGGFGKVYKANLDGREVAIKRLSRDSEQGIEEFRNEVILIAKLQHRNLVKFLGCCIDGEEKLLVFEYMPNKSLDALLFRNTRKIMLDWQTRFNIIKGIAKGLLYLHQDSRLKIIHRDLKASNILLDEEMRPKVADFGMARMFGDSQQSANTKRVVGTFGYMAPEYAMRGIFSVKSDVYSFGVLTLEVVSGVKISSSDHITEFENLLAYAWKLWKEGNAKDLVDSSIVDSCILDEALLCIHMALLCVQDNPNDRPLMSSVVFVLENGTNTLPIPNKHVYFSHTNNEVEQRRGDSQNSKNSVTLTVLEGR
ncbi:hypothetical protein ACP70R_044612 [Stipagrostis hirtigluma subsp. patula]